MPVKTTDDQVLEALRRNGGIRSKAAQECGISTRALISRIGRMKERGIEVQESDYLTVDRSLYMQGATGTSTLYDAEGKPKLQWVKRKHERGPEDWAPIVKDVFADTPPVKPIPPPKSTNKSLLTVYPIGDHHVAMYAWAEEAGSDYDIGIAERLLVSAARHLVDVAPASETALIVDVGDFFHVDTIRNETVRSGHPLDVDTRYAAMIRAGVAMLRTCIETALTKHRRVKVICSPGNHNDLGALWLSLALGLLYEKNPRVEIEQTPAKFAYHRHGKVLLGVTHGDTVKLDKLAGVMATDRAKEWGETEHRYWLTGHIHHRKVIEAPGVMIESFRTLAARDAWASAAGYRSGRDMTAIVFHDQHGEVARHRFDVGMLA